MSIYPGLIGSECPILSGYEPRYCFRNSQPSRFAYKDVYSHSTSMTVRVAFSIEAYDWGQPVWSVTGKKKHRLTNTREPAVQTAGSFIYS